MPKSLDPESRLTIVLACDADKPPETRPEIYAKSPTLGTQRKIIALLRKFGTGVKFTDYESLADEILDVAERCLSGWKNIPTPFSRDGIQEVLTLEEIAEVIGFLASSSSPTADDKKKSE